MTQAEQIDRVRRVLLAARRVFVLTGAGISAESGVPTFRGGGQSLVWRGRPFEELSSARMVRENLPLVWEWFDYRRAVVEACEPNAGHIAIADAGRSARFDAVTLITQNIDGLHQRAGSVGIIELHGNIHRARCLSCDVSRQVAERPRDERPPLCPSCTGTMRPDVVLFGENLRAADVLAARAAAEECDACIVVGTSAVVYPANELPLVALRSGAVFVEINPEETPLTPYSHFHLCDSAARALPAILER